MSRFVAINLAGMSPPDIIETLETGNNLACGRRAVAKPLRLPVKGRGRGGLVPCCCWRKLKPEGFAAALRKSLSDAHGMERLFEVWEQKC